MRRAYRCVGQYNAAVQASINTPPSTCETMKTQLIPLESHDDIISIRDKMSWAKTPRILLVWPSGGQVDVRPLDLTLLRRHATSLGAELGLVTRNAEIRAAARRIDLPVFSKPAQAQRKTWPLRISAHAGRRAPRLDLRSVRAALPNRELFDDFRESTLARLIVFSMGVLAVLFLPLFFIPSAEISLTAPTRPQSVEIDVSAEPAAEQVSLTGVIPSHLLSYNVELTDSIAATGQAGIPNQAADGMLRFTNVSAPAVDVPEGTVVLPLSAPPVLFATVEAARVAPGAGSTAYARARALSPGTIGDLPPGSLTAFEGSLGLSLRVTNPAGTRGGADLPTVAPIEADRQTLHDRLLKSLETLGRQRLAAQFQPGDVVFPTSFGFSRLVQETYTPAIGQPGSKLTLTLRAEFHAYYAAAADLQQLAGSVLDTSLPPGYDPVAKSLNISPVSVLFGDTDGLTHWRIHASRTLRARIEPAQVISIVQGKTVQRAGTLLRETFGLESAPQIRIRPFFWPWLPALPLQIKVTG